MKQIRLLCALLLCAALLCACGGTAEGTPDGGEIRWAKIPMVMVEGRLYYDTGRESTLTDRCGTADGEITSTVDDTESPTRDGQSNFGAPYDYQYGEADTIEIEMDGAWRIFEYRSGDGSTVRFGDQWISTGDLSEETLQWLQWYSGLSAEEQLCVDSIPAELIELLGLNGGDTQAADAER